MDIVAFKAEFARKLAEAHQLLDRMQAVAREERTAADSRRTIQESRALLRRL